MNSKTQKILSQSVIVVMVIALLTSTVSSVRAAAGDVTRVSVDSSGAEANGGSGRGQISGDGRYVVFESNATNLAGGSGGLFLKDRQTGAVTRISVEGEAGSISSDGRFVAFDSGAANEVSGDTNGLFDIFVWDRQSGLTTRASVDSSGVEANADSTTPAISGNGRFVAFATNASNLVGDDTNGAGDVFVHDNQSGTTERVSLASDRTQANGRSFDVSISADGRIVVFSSSATNLVSGDTNGATDVFAHDRQTGVTIRVSVNSSGVEADHGASDSSISADGRYVSFSSFSENLMSQEPLGFEHVFVFDRQTGTTTLASAYTEGYQMQGRSEQSVLSADGRYVAFEFDDRGDGMPFIDISIHDRLTGATISAPGGHHQESSFGPSLSGDGRYLTYATAFALVAGDTNGAGDVFLYEPAFGADQSPTVSSVQAPCVGSACSYPSPSTVSFHVNFSESVTGVTADDFSLTVTGGINGASIVSVSGSVNTYTVTVNTGTGNGTLRLDVQDNDSIQDIALKPLGGVGVGNGNFTSGEVYVVDKTIPAVISVTRADPSPTGSATVNFTVTFSEDVTGVDSQDFIPNTSGNISGAVVTEVTGSGKTYNVKVNTGSGDGSLRLNVIDDDSIRDVDNHPIGGDGTSNGTFTHGEDYTINRFPVVFSSLRLDPSPTTATTINFTVTFNEDVSGVDQSDFMPSATGNISNAVVTNVSGAGSTYTVTVSIGAGAGTIRLDVVDNDSIVDSESNSLGSLGTGNGNYSGGDAYVIETSVPVVISSLRADASPTAADNVRFTVTFSEAVSGVDASDFVLTASGLSGVSILGVSGSANIYTVTVAIGNGNGTLRLDVVDNDSILDSVSNPLGGVGAGNGNFATGETYTIQKNSTISASTDFRSTGARDGWVLEKNENLNVGGSKNSNAGFIKLGDDSQDRQFRSILHFPTYYLPDNAVVTRVILMLKKQDTIGTDPFTTHQNITIDIHKGPFSNFNLLGLWSLQVTDFEAPADAYAVGTIQNNPVSGWYWAMLDSTAFRYINLTDITQIRLGFQLDDNDDMGEDSIRFYSGDTDAQSNRPHLLIDYYVPR